MNTHRAHLGADTTLTCWVRDDAGKRDLTGATLSVPLYVYGVSTELTTLDATSPATGKVEIDITQAQADTLGPGLYRFAVLADGAHVYGGLLEIV